MNTPFSYAHKQAINLILGRPPTLFERATADALWKAYEASQESPRQFKAVSAATGAGKTKGAIALLACLFPARTAIVIKEIKEAHEAYLDLCKLVGADNVAIHTSVHRVGAATKDISRFIAETGHQITRQYTEEEFRSAPVVVCTHKRWQDEILADSDRGVRLCDGMQRDLIVIDEEPGLERVFVAQPEDVSKLASVLTDTLASDEGRAWFGGTHPAVGHLTAIHNRMREAKDSILGTTLLAQEDLVAPAEADVIRSLTRDDIYHRLGHLPAGTRIALTDQLDGVREFLLAACEGRVFYARGIGGAFYAYSYCIPPQRNTIILDGTADLNGLYAVSKSVITIDTPEPDYRDVQSTYVAIPKAYSGIDYWNPANVRKVRESSQFMDWFRGTLLANTRPGESVLVYCPLVLLDTDLHRKFDEGSAQVEGVNRDYYCEWEGRRIHWCHFGSGRGTNRYKDCTVYFQIRAFFKPKAVIVAQVGSMSGEKIEAERLKNLSSGRTSDPVYTNVRDTLIACDTKQNAARCCIRHLDDTGKARPARLYFVGDDLSLTSEYHSQMFPGAPGMVLEMGDAPVEGKSTSTERLAHLLATSEASLLVGPDVLEATGLLRNHVVSAFRSRPVQAVIDARGWQKLTLREAGLAGKGWALIRIAQSSS